MINGKAFLLQFEDKVNSTDIIIPIKSKYLLYEMDPLPQLCNFQLYFPKNEDLIKNIEISLYYQSKPR